ncbi:MAG TPA: LLM class flavin-dependent oxidoreductase [Stellaceae bacterium]|nr:LLM class flavin-dependent oxidoreductase [Stellaceae bacterium]HUK09498.1 LLM class flavin-dependent oxidoreductase [Stellaceae bacterium]
MRFSILAVPYMRERGESVALAGSDRKRFQILMHKLREQMQFAETLGYDGFCMTEQHMQIEGIETTTNPLFWDYFVAQHTKTMRVGQLGMNLTVVNPIQLAENIAMLDHFTGGRAFCGFSRGNTPRWTATFGQHVDVMSTDSDKSDADRRNRAIFYENWKIVKALWTQETVRIEGEFWKVPKEIEWHFHPTDDWAPDTIGPDKTLRKIGIVPRPLQEPHPPVYAPFSYSMETVRFWAREGGKMVSFVSEDKEKFIPIMLDSYLKEAEAAGRASRPRDALAIGGHLLMGRNPAETKDIHEGFVELFNYAYNAPPYNVPVGRLWMGSRQQVLDHVARLARQYDVEEFFLWHHIGYFPQDVEMAMLREFAESVIEPMGV